MPIIHGMEYYSFFMYDIYEVETSIATKREGKSVDFREEELSIANKGTVGKSEWIGSHKCRSNE